jgi:HNH endonuclease
MTQPSVGYLHQLLRYDAEAGKLYWRARTPAMFTDGHNTAIQNCRTWNTKNAGNEAGTINDQGYRIIMIHRQRYRAHRIIWAMHTGEWPVGEIDHESGDRSDSRFENLRDVTPQINRQNRAMSRRNTSGVMGVSWSKAMNKWHAYIGTPPRLTIGYFADLADATAARKAAEADYRYHPNHGRD